MRSTELEKRPEMIEQVRMLARTSTPQKFIAPQLGISYSTLRNYLIAGEKLMDQPPVDEDGQPVELSKQQQLYLEFFKAYEVSRSELILDFHDKVWEKAEPRTLITLMERLFPREFAVKTVFDEEDLERWLRSNFTEEAQNRILEIMRSDIDARLYE